MSTPCDELRASLEQHNTEFEALLRLIPAKYYITPDESAEFHSKYAKNSKKHNAPKQAIKEATKRARRDKLDPEKNGSILDIRKEALQSKSNGIKKQKRMEVASSEDEDEDADEEATSNDNSTQEPALLANGMDLDDDEVVGAASQSTGNAALYKPMEPTSDVEALRAKLHARMKELRQKSGPRRAAGVGSSKDDLLEERRQQRAAMRERRRKEKRERVKKEEEEKRSKGKGRGKQQQGTSTRPAQLIVPDVSRNPLNNTDPKLTNVSFSNISGTKPSVSKTLKTSSNPTQALSQLQKRSEARSALPAEKRKELEERDAWAKATARVEGAKVHDDTSRVAKSVKRKEKEKKKSKEEWGKRKEQVVNDQAARQKKRTDNIAMRHEKRKGGGKKEKKRPGFEGKGFGGGKKAGIKGKGKK